MLYSAVIKDVPIVSFMSQDNETKPFLTLLEKVFLTSAGVLLTITALGKLKAVRGEAPILLLADPVVWFLTNAQMMLMAALLELAVVFILILRGRELRAKPILWVSCLFAVYRVGRMAAGASGPLCPCLGSIQTFLPFSEETIDAFMTACFIYLLAGSAFLSSRLYGRMRSRALGVADSFGATALIAISCALLSERVARSAPLEFTATGQLTSTFSQKGVQQSSVVVPFTASVSGSNVWIRVDRSVLRQGIQYEEFRSPGTNGYSLLLYGGTAENALAKRFNPKTGKLEDMGAATQKLGNDATMVITSEPFPEWKKDYSTPIWLAVAGALFFQESSGEARLPAIYPLGEDPAARDVFAREGRRVLTKWSKNSTGEFLNELLIKRGGKAVIQAGTTLREEDLPPFLSTFNTAVEFRVLKWTNALGRQMPQEFTMTRRTLAVTPAKAAEIGKSEPLEKFFDVVLFSGRIASIVPEVNAENFSPWIPTAARVIENRFARADPAISGVDYMVSDGKLLGLSEVKNLPRYKAMEREALKRGRTTKRTMVTALLAVILVLPLLISVKKMLVRNS